MTKTSNDYSNDYGDYSADELEVDITSEFQMFLDSELGLDQSRYELSAMLVEGSGHFKYKYSVSVRLLDADADDFVTVFAGNIDELYDHLEFLFPHVQFDISMEAAGTIITTEDTEIETEDDSYARENELIEADPDDEEEESLESQLEDEGLRVVDDIEETDTPMFERGVDDESEEDDEDIEYESKDKKKKPYDLDDELEDVNLDEEDDYIPDDEDREELWKAFGDFDE